MKKLIRVIALLVALPLGLLQAEAGCEAEFARIEAQRGYLYSRVYACPTKELFWVVLFDPYNVEKIAALLREGAKVFSEGHNKPVLIEFLIGVRHYRYEVSGKEPDFFPVTSFLLLAESGACLTASYHGYEPQYQESWIDPSFVEQMQQLAKEEEEREQTGEKISRKYRDGLQAMQLFMQKSGQHFVSEEEQLRAKAGM